MNIFKDPAYASLRAIVLIIVFVGIGAFTLNASRNDSLSQTGQVIGGKTTPVTTLKVGMKRNAEVKALQEFLTKRKFFTGKIDGNFGRDTEEAVKKFQSKYQLKPTGTFGQSWVDENPGMMPPEEETFECGIDFNDDGVTSVADLDILMSQYGSTGDGFETDLDNDGVVGISDMLILIGAYGESTTCNLVVSLTEGEEEINETHFVDVDNSQTTDEVPVLAFTLEQMGSLDLLIQEIPVRFTSTEAMGNDPEDIIDSVYLVHDGQVLDEKSLSINDANDGIDIVTFDGFELQINESGEVQLEVWVDVKPTTTLLEPGDTLKAEITDTERSAINVENQDGDELTLNQRLGTALAQPVVFLESGMMLQFISGQSFLNTPPNSGTFEITFSATAFDNDVYIDKSTPLTNGGTGEADLGIIGVGNLVSAVITTTSGATSTPQAFMVEEGETEQFTITAVVQSAVDGFSQVSLENLVYALTNIDGNLSYTYGLDEFVTPTLFLDVN